MRLLALMVLVAAPMLSLGIHAAAGGAEPDPESRCLREYVPHLGAACRLADGHFLVFLEDGTTLLTHGPDPVTPDAHVGFTSSSAQREPVCADAWYMHVLYGYPSDTSSRYEAVADELRAAVRRMNALLNADALETGRVQADFNVACEGGRIRVDAFAGPQTGGNAYTTDFSAVVDSARRAGFTSTQADYLIFYDDTSDGVCGVGNIAYDESLSANNQNMIGPDYGVTYKNCWFGRTPMHENGHNQGAVQRLAPMSDLAGHCLEGIDVMCYPTSAILVLCSDRIHYDCNHDTYFHAAPPPGSWLASHWNIGSRLNRYITFHDAPSNPTTSAPAPTSSTAASSTPNTASTTPTTTRPTPTSPSPTYASPSPTETTPATPEPTETSTAPTSPSATPASHNTTSDTVAADETDPAPMDLAPAGTAAGARSVLVIMAAGAAAGLAVRRRR